MGRMTITFRGIAERDTNEEGRAAFIRPRSMSRPTIAYNDVVFRPLSVHGPASVNDRPARVELSRADLARLIDQIPAQEFADNPELLNAWKILTAHLRGETGAQG